jgi:hypothetical protein
MATTDTLCFGIQDGITGKPDVDGLVDYDMLPYNGVPEVGYTNGCKMTYEGGTFPRVVFQGVHQTIGDDRLVLGFMCRFDVSFDTDDFIVILFRQSAGSGAGPRRMIVIRPNIAGLGADVGTGDPMFPGYEIKRDKPPNEMHFYKELGGAWDEYFPPAALVDVKVRSWKPGRFVDADPECCWSVEVSVPRTAMGGDWIALNNDFGLYFNVVRINNPAATVKQSFFPTTNQPMDDFPGANYPDHTLLQWGHGLVPNPGDPNVGVGVHFINGWQGVGRRRLGTNDPLTGTIEGPSGTDNEIVALVENSGEVAANDVSAEFRFRNYGLPASPQLLAWDKPLGMTNNPTPGANLAATNGTAELKAQWPHNQVDPGYAAHPDQCFAVTLSSPNDVNFNQAAVRRNMWVGQFSEVEKDAEISGEGYPEPADGSGQIDFLLETFCRQINVAERMAEKEVGNPEVRALIESLVPPPRGEVPKIHGGPAGSPTTTPPAWTNSVIYVWMTIGSRRTGTFMNIEGRSYEILDETPGEFGIAAYHEGLQDKLSFSFDGPGLVQYAPGSYGLKVPWKGTTTIKVKIGAGPEGPGGDVTKSVPREPWPKPPGFGGPGPGPGPGEPPKGCLAALMGMFSKKS